MKTTNVEREHSESLKGKTEVKNTRVMALQTYGNEGNENRSYDLCNMFPVYLGSDPKGKKPA